VIILLLIRVWERAEKCSPNDAREAIENDSTMSMTTLMTMGDGNNDGSNVKGSNNDNTCPTCDGFYCNSVSLVYTDNGLLPPNSILPALMALSAPIVYTTSAQSGIEVVNMTTTVPSVGALLILALILDLYF